jgi:uncharacterized membrane protein
MNFWHYLNDPVVSGIIGILFLLFLLYLIKSFFKFVMISILIIFFSLVGYHYFHAEGNFNERMRDALMGTKGQIGRLADKGKQAVFWGKKIIDQKQSSEEKPEGHLKKRLQFEDL